MSEKEFYSDIDANGNRIYGVADAVGMTDAVNLESMIAYVAAHGGGGGGTGSVTYTFNTPSTQWTINHMLGHDPSVTVVVGTDQVLADVTHSVDHNVSYVSFGSLQTGKAVIV